MGKPFPQGLEPGEEFRDNDILGLYKPNDTASAVDGSLNKSKTIAELKTMIEDEVINTNTDNIAVNSSDITTLEGRATVNEDDIDALEVRATDLETRATTNEGDVTALEGKVGQSLNTTDNVTFAGITNNGATNPTSTPTSGVWSADQVIPKGQYNVTLTSGSGGFSQIRQNGSIIMFYDASSDLGINQLGGGFFSDGVNTTVSLSGTSTVLWWKF